MSRRLSLAALVVLLLAGCRPVGLAGDDCEDGPCAAGLLCVRGRCELPPEPECVNDEGCRVDGAFAGRVCVDEVCVDAACEDDGDCGQRICDLGVCTDREPCAADAECGAGRVCEAGACRDGCDEDGDCGGFASCVEARCLQQCFLDLDLLCLGDICEEGLCVPPECAVDPDCGEGNVFCDGGRCATFTPCDEDDDCFDPNFRCNELGRCEERALCRTDPECGQGALCLDRHCRPAETCQVSEDCSAPGRECVAGRCVVAPGCRGDLDCAPAEACLDLRCVEVVDESAASLVVESPWGRCASSGAGACTLSLFVGERLDLVVGLLDEGGVPVRATVEASAPLGVVAVAGRQVSFTASAAGAAQLTVTSGAALHDALSVRVLPDSADALRVLVIDEQGALVAGADVRAGAEVATTDADGLARFPTEPAAVGEPAVQASAAGRGVRFVGAPLSGDLRLQLPAPPAAPPGLAAGVTARVLSTGDELGPVGAGLVLPSVGSGGEATLAALFGEPFAGAISLPLIGDLPVSLPAGATLSASLPIVGDTDVKELAFVRGAGGPSAVTALEGRFEQAQLFGVFGGGDDVAVALNLAAAAEGLDLLVELTGDLEALPLVQDGDLADGVADIDGDGDSAELVPDYLSFPELELRPDRQPDERVGLRTGPLPDGSRARALVVLGHEVPGVGAIPAGLGVTTGGDAQVKARAPSVAALADAPRFVRIEAVLDEGGTSSLARRLPAFAREVDLGAFLGVPAGSFTLPDVPAPGQQLITLPGAPSATTYRARVTTSALTLEIIAAARDGGRSLILEEVGAVLGPLEVLRLPGADADGATLAPFTRGGSLGPVDARAEARARE